MEQRGYTLVPLRLYFKEGWAKVELGAGRGKTHEDRRDHIAERETRREMDRAMGGPGGNSRSIPVWAGVATPCQAYPATRGRPRGGSPELGTFVRAMFDRVKLVEDLADCSGAVLAPRGTVISAESIAEARDHAPPASALQLAETLLSDDLELPCASEVHRPLFGRCGAREAVEGVLRAIASPSRWWTSSGRPREQPLLYRHASSPRRWAARVLLAAVVRAARSTTWPRRRCSTTSGCATCRRACSDRRDSPRGGARHRVAAHPLLGAYQLARVLGRPPGGGGGAGATTGATGRATPASRAAVARPPTWWRWRAPSAP